VLLGGAGCAGVGGGVAVSGFVSAGGAGVGGWTSARGAVGLDAGRGAFLRFTVSFADFFPFFLGNIFTDLPISQKSSRRVRA